VTAAMAHSPSARNTEGRRSKDPAGIGTAIIASERYAEAGAFVPPESDGPCGMPANIR
jgi:hypothetical protein